MAENLDPACWAIPTELQRNGRVPFTELGRRVSLSSAAVTERVGRLEPADAITGYRAAIDLEKDRGPLRA
ncbi:Lrp/AsnC family transcriptional regulator [Streptosporangium algeriense]|uniref:Lrp/AsnC family transcriptional regulator n=1 Tax=Streptosporangium algeriense TaxID=1682748 RepID=A0ABW3DX54_9ACTN